MSFAIFMIVPRGMKALRKLEIVADKDILTGDDSSYYDWDEYDLLEKQREYFSANYKTNIQAFVQNCPLPCNDCKTYK